MDGTHHPVSLGTPQCTVLSTRAFRVTEALYRGGSTLPQHHHDRTVVAVAIEGRWDSVLGSRRFELSEGDVHTQPAGDSHSNHFTRQGARVLIIQPDPAAGEFLRPCRTLLRTGVQVAVPEASALATSIRRELYLPDALSPLAVEAACLELLSAVCRAGSAARAAGAPPWLSRIVDYIHAHFLDSQTVEGLSAIGGVHPAHFAREFRRAYRRPPAAYLRQLRIEWAAVRLLRDDVPIVEIAGAAGFADQSHFTRLFRRAMGVTPAAYRRARRAPDGSLP